MKDTPSDSAGILAYFTVIPGKSTSIFSFFEDALSDFAGIPAFFSITPGKSSSIFSSLKDSLPDSAGIPAYFTGNQQEPFNSASVIASQ